MSVPKESDSKAWIERWRRCGPVLEEIRRRELREFKQSENAHIVDGLMQLGHDPPVRRETSGLVEQQRLFRRARS